MSQDGSLRKKVSSGLRSLFGSGAAAGAGRKLQRRGSKIDAAIAKATASADTTPPKRKKFKSFQKPRF